MTKRTNPFIDDFLPQSKIHVSLKKYDKHSTDNEKRLKKVYEKTLQMLFNGAKKGTTTETNNNLQDSKVRKDKKKTIIYRQRWQSTTFWLSDRDPINKKKLSLRCYIRDQVCIL